MTIIMIKFCNLIYMRAPIHSHLVSSHTHTHTCMHAHTHYTHTYTHTHTHTHVTHIRTCNTHTHTCNTHTHTHVTHTHTHVTYTHIHVTHTHTCNIHSYIYVHTCILTYIIVIDSGCIGLRHFIYKSKKTSCLTSPRLPVLYCNPQQKERSEIHMY